MWEFIARSLEASTIFTLAALGELLGQRSGILNVGIEGIMLFGATFGFIAAQNSDSYVVGFAVAILVGALLGSLHGFFSITLGVDQVVSGMGIWILGFGLTTFIGNPYTGPLGMDRIPTVFGFSPFFLLSVILVALMWFVLTKTSLGLRIRSVGENPSVAEVSGISVARTRYMCVIVGGMLMGFAGASLFARLQPGLELQFPDGLGFHRAGAGLLLAVEPLDVAGRLAALRLPVAALAQPAAACCRASSRATSGARCPSSSRCWC